MLKFAMFLVFAMIDKKYIFLKKSADLAVQWEKITPKRRLIDYHFNSYYISEALEVVD